MSYLDEMRENEEEKQSIVKHQIFLKKQAKLSMKKQSLPYNQKKVKQSKDS